MNFKIVFHLVSLLLMIIAAAMGITAGVSYLMGDPVVAWTGMLESAAITIVIALFMWIITRSKAELSRREGIGIVVFGWFASTLLGCLPFLTTHAMTNPYDAYFESCSGFATTGASVMTDLELHSRAILLWRAVTHFLGGMGILVLVVAIIPYLGVGGMQIFNAEVTGPSKDRLTPRIASTAKLLWGVYVIMNVALIILLKFGGMDWFDSVCHAFAAIATGGFSTRTAGIAAFHSTYIETVLIIFMLLSGINFALHFKAMRGKPLSYFRDAECRFYLGVWFIAFVLVAGNLSLSGLYDVKQAIRHAAFYVTSLMTSTGFCTVDYDVWPVFSKSILMLLMIIGGCAGSTSGGVKHMRVIVLLKKMARDIRSFLKPQAVYTVKLGRQIVAPEIVVNIAIFFFIYMLTMTVSTIAISPFSKDLITAFSAVVTCLGGVGPGFSAVGPMANFEHLPDTAIIILSMDMLLGRLEFYTLLVVLMPTFWRK